MRRRIEWLLVVVVGVLGMAAPAPDGAAPTSRPATTADVEALVARLGRGSYRKRQEAARRLAEIGAGVVPVLQRHAQSQDAETALAARELIAELENVFFSGCRVRIEAEPTRVRWDEPVTVRVLVENPTAFAAALPWERRPATSQPATTAERVGLMLDVADYLNVIGPEGEPVELRVETISEDAGVEQAVIRRVEAGPVRELAPGARTAATLVAFNRGWARYPLLAAGRYTLRFAYQPEWSNSGWIAAGVGRVESQPVEIVVTEPAPPAVLGGAQPMELRAERRANEFVATLESTWDVDQYLNLNFGADTSLFAQVRWTINAGHDEPIVVVSPPGRDGMPAPWSRRRVRRVRPGERVEVGRITRAALLAAARQQGAGVDAAKATVQARYVCFGSREALRQLGEVTVRAQDRERAAWACDLDWTIFSGAPSASELPLIASGAD